MTSRIIKNGEICLLLLMKADGDLFKMCVFYSANSRKPTDIHSTIIWGKTSRRRKKKEAGTSKRLAFFPLENDSLIFATLIWIFLSFRLLVGQKRKSGKIMHIISHCFQNRKSLSHMQNIYSYVNGQTCWHSLSKSSTFTSRKLFNNDDDDDSSKWNRLLSAIYDPK